MWFSNMLIKLLRYLWKLHGSCVFIFCGCIIEGNILSLSRACYGLLGLPSAFAWELSSSISTFGDSQACGMAKCAAVKSSMSKKFKLLSVLIEKLKNNFSWYFSFSVMKAQNFEVVFLNSIKNGDRTSKFSALELAKRLCR